MFVRPRVKKRSIYSGALDSAAMTLDPYSTPGLAGIDDGLGDPLSDVFSSVKGQLAALKQGLTLSAAMSTAAAIGVVLLLVTMPKGRK